MLNFNQQLLNSFFYEKKVEYNHELFKQYYYSIFPSPQLFVSFLSSNNRQEQTIYAKRIIKRMCFCKYNSILFNLYKNLIDLEETRLINEANAHIPRDHSIHSVNTYLLGIYLYFSFGIFNKQLDFYFSKTQFREIYCKNHKENTFLCFLDCWEIFSLNHDIGYPLELLLDTDGHFFEENNFNLTEKLDHISDLMVAEYTKNELVFLISLQIIADNSKTKLSEVLYTEELDTIRGINHTFCDYIRLENIYSYKSFLYYESAFELEYLCFKVKDIKTGKHLFLYPNDKNNSILNFINLTNNDSGYISKDKLLNTNYYIEFFYPENKCKRISDNSLSEFISYADDIKDASREILSQNTISYAGISDEESYIEFLFSIYSSVESNLSVGNRKPSKIYYKRTIKDFILFVSNNIIRNYSESLIDYNKPIPDNLEFIYDNALEFLNNPATKDKNMAEFLDTKNSNVRFNLLHIYNHIKSQYHKILSTYRKSLFLQIENDKISKKNCNPDFEKFCNDFISVYGALCKDSKLITNETDVIELMNYMPSYSLFDHGIASCYLVLETYFKALKISENTFEFNQSGFSIHDKTIMEIASYSILIHNIYVSFFNTLSSEQPVKHDILKNPFVYFALFCDNMQIWDRPYRINQGKLELKNSTVSSKDIAIVPTGNKLCIQCITLETEKIVANYREDLDSYLKDGSKLISLNISDK